MKEALKELLERYSNSPELVDLHVHTNYCDGEDTPRCMLDAARAVGLAALGLVAHSYVDFDPETSIPYEKLPDFLREIRSLSTECDGELSLFAGIEEDYYTSLPHDGFDYKIGSVHYMYIDGEYLPLDLNRDSFISLANDKFGGDFIALCERYFSMVGELSQRDDIDIIGHFDLVTKFNEGDKLFSTSDARYITAYRAAADRLLSAGKIFEVNFGAIYRGYKTTPYPAEDILKYIREKGALTVYSSDAHRKINLKLNQLNP